MPGFGKIFIKDTESKKLCTIIPAQCLILLPHYYARNYASIMWKFLVRSNFALGERKINGKQCPLFPASSIQQLCPQCYKDKLIKFSGLLHSQAMLPLQNCFLDFPLEDHVLSCYG